MRSYLAMVLCGITSPTKWVRKYLRDPSGFYAVISGFDPGDVPSVGGFYQFVDRLMQLPKYCKEHQIRRKRKRLSQTEKQRLKADKKKVTKRHVKITARLRTRIRHLVARDGGIETPFGEMMVNDILESCCISESQRRGLCNKTHLNLAADGSKLPVHGNRYGKKVCDCQHTCDCKRYYNAKDASIGYDAYHDCYVYGHSLYQLNSFSLSHTTELPIYLSMVTAARHDSVASIYALQRARQRFGIDHICLDAAHDATAIYQMADELWHTQVHIPLNTTNQGNLKQMPMATINADGIPICQAGHQMYCTGHCNDRDRIKWRCPKKATKKGQMFPCDFQENCSTSDYGRVVYTHPKDNLRLYPVTPRNTPTFKAYYDKRSSAERIFKREKNDFKLTQLRTRSKARHLFYALLTAIAVHVDAWYRQDQQTA